MWQWKVSFIEQKEKLGKVDQENYLSSVFILHYFTFILTYIFFPFYYLLLTDIAHTCL